MILSIFCISLAIFESAENLSNEFEYDVKTTFILECTFLDHNEKVIAR